MMPAWYWLRASVVALRAASSATTSSRSPPRHDISIEPSRLISATTRGLSPQTVQRMEACPGSVRAVVDSLPFGALVTDREGKNSSRVSAVYEATPRKSFVAALKDVPEIWEISYDPKADDIAYGERSPDRVRVEAGLRGGAHRHPPLLHQATAHAAGAEPLREEQILKSFHSPILAGP